MWLWWNSLAGNHGCQIYSQSGQIGTKWDKKCTERWSEKKAQDLSDLGPIWHTLEPNLPALLQTVVPHPGVIITSLVPLEQSGLIINFKMQIYHTRIVMLFWYAHILKAYYPISNVLVGQISQNIKLSGSEMASYIVTWPPNLKSQNQPFFVKTNIPLVNLYIIFVA